MTTRLIFPLLLVALISASGMFWGCSKDSNPTTPPVDPSKYISITLRAGARFNYDRWDLDTSNNKVASSKRTYTTDIRGNNGLILGIYNDWFYRIGTDAVSLKKDTIFIRTENKTNGSVVYTQKVQVYGFTQKIMNLIVNQITSQFPVPSPVIPGATWDDLAVYADASGNPVDVGTEWNIGNVNGSDITFTIVGIPVVVNIRCKGKLEAKDEKITVGSKQVNTWKTSATITMSLMSSVYQIKMYTWFSSDPAGQIWLLQESTVINLLNNTLPFPGEKQELSTYL